MDTSNCNFTVGEIVWGKIKGYSWWPAIITGTRDDNKEKKYICNFIGDNSHASLIKKSIAKFEKELNNYSNTKKKDLLLAIKEAKNLYYKKNSKIQNKEKDYNESNNISDEDESFNSQLMKKKKKKKNKNNHTIPVKKASISKQNNFLIPIYKGKDKENSDAINKIIIYLLYITKNIQNKNFSILEEEKSIFSKVLEFLKDYKMNEPINFLKKTNIGKLIKYININVPEGEFKEFTNAVYSNLQDQVVAQLFQKNK